MEFPGPVEVVTLSVAFLAVTFRHHGLYRWQVAYGSTVVAEQRFTVTQIGGAA